MLSINRKLKLSTCAAALAQVFFLNQTSAAEMNFDSPLMPPSVFGSKGASYAQGGLENTSINFNDTSNENSHIHGNNSGGSQVSQLEADAGGGLFRAETGNKFSFESWRVVTLNTALIISGGDSTLHVVGIRDGAQVASITLTNADAGTTIDFLARDSEFGNVDKVEYWFSPAGRGEDPSSDVDLRNLLLEIDDVNFDLTPVAPPTQTGVMDFETPVMPAAVYGSDGKFYAQGGLEHTSIDFTDGEENSHVHGKSGNGGRVSELEADAGGALFRTTTGDKFSFKSWDLVSLNLARTGGGESTFHVVGMRDGVKVANTTLTSDEVGTKVDFLARDVDFGNVDQVEYWFTPPGRGVDPADPKFNQTLFGLLAGVDNVSFDLQATTVPALSLKVSASQTSFTTGESLKLDVGASSPGLQSMIDVYMIILMPDGDSLVYFIDLEANLAFGNASNLAGLTPMAASIDMSAPFAANLPDFFIFNWTGQESAGDYVAYLVMVKAGSLNDGNLDQDDILQIDKTEFSFTP